MGGTGAAMGLGLANRTGLAQMEITRMRGLTSQAGMASPEAQRRVMAAKEKLGRASAALGPEEAKLARLHTMELYQNEAQTADTHERVAQEFESRRRRITGMSALDIRERTVLARRIGGHRGQAAASRAKMERLGLGMTDEEKQRGIEGLGKEVEEQEQRVADMKKRQVDATKEQIEAQHQLNQAKIEDLKTMQQQTAEFAKQATSARKQAEGRVQSGKLTIGRMSLEDRAMALHIKRKAKAGQELNPEEMQFAGSHDFLREEAEAQAMRNFKQGPGGEELLEGLNANAAEARKVEEQAIKLDAELKTKIDMSVKADDKFLDEMRTKLAEILDRWAAQLKEATDTAVNRAIARMLTEQRNTH
jgi:hypothetical protein